jgi:protein-S-isoprenylcysteine O-methyltransferase Ste14
MSVKRHEGQEREAPNSHIYQSVLPLIFIIIWVLDSQIFGFSTFLNSYIPFIIRLILFFVVMATAILFVILSHRTLFKSHQPSSVLITNGILRYVRNPMYFGILLVYVAFLFLSVSLISLGFFVIVFFVYNWMVNFEEKLLEEMFGDEYKNYKERVAKWIPNLFKK